MNKVIARLPKTEQKIESVIDNENIKKCLNCRSTNIVFDPQSGEKLCENCGVVLAEKLESPESQLKTKPEDQTLGIHTGIPSSLAHVDKGLSTVIPYTTTDGNGTALNPEQRINMYKMRRWNKISNSNRSYHRNLNDAFSVLLRIKDKLSLSNPLTEKAAHYYRKILDLNIIKGRSIKGFVVTSVYISCREANVPRTLEEISKVIDTDQIFAGKCYRLVMRLMGIKLPEIDTRSHLVKIASNAGVSEKTLRRAADLMSILKENPVSFGKDPNALAVAVLLAACLDVDEKISKVRLAKSANTSLVTLRKRFLDVRKVFPNIPGQRIK